MKAECNFWCFLGFPISSYTIRLEVDLFLLPLSVGLVLDSLCSLSSTLKLPKVQVGVYILHCYSLPTPWVGPQTRVKVLLVWEQV